MSGLFVTTLDNSEHTALKLDDRHHLVVARILVSVSLEKMTGNKFGIIESVLKIYAIRLQLISEE